MSRTYRRRGERHEYRWVLYDRSDATPWWAHGLLDPRSKEGRRAIARFHSDAEVTMRSGVPHWFCKIFKRRERNADTRELLRWLADPEYDPIMQSRHRHSAKWAWW
jgi:hypothetical protein